MTCIQTTLKQLRSELLNTGARLVAVSKYHPAEAIREAYDAGQRVFGESHVQELDVKRKELPSDIEWHFIGHLQTNKVKYIVPYVSLIHAVDSMKLLREIDKQAGRVGRTVDCLLQLHVAREETKFGFLPTELLDTLQEGEYRRLDHVRVRGLMCMATNTDDETRIRSEFRLARKTFEEVHERFFHGEESFNELSMGMSDDYRIALEEGSTLVRVGSMIFGPRDYSARQ